MEVSLSSGFEDLDFATVFLSGRAAYGTAADLASTLNQTDIRGLLAAGQ
jgi:hypothetical protein